MARKGILPRRKRGRASIVPAIGDNNQRSTYNSSSNNLTNISVRNVSNHSNRSESPFNEPPYHFAHFKLDLEQV